MASKGERTGPAVYELLCSECGQLTPAVTGPSGEVDLDEALVCGHESMKREVVVYRRPGQPER